MRSVLRLIFRSLHILGVESAAQFVRNTRLFLMLTCLPIYVFGLVDAYWIDAAWPLWFSIVWCGMTWFVFEARVMILATVGQLIPKKIWKYELPEVPAEFGPANIGRILSTIGMWALVPHLAAATTGIYHSVNIPGIGLVNLYLPFLGLIVMILYLVATAKISLEFWRQILGWGVGIVIVGMVIVVIALRVAPNSLTYLTHSWARADANKTLDDTYDANLNTVQTTQLQNDNASVVSLEAARLAWKRTNPGQPWPRQVEYDNLVTERNELKTSIAARDTQTASAVANATSKMAPGRGARQQATWGLYAVLIAFGLIFLSRRL